MKGKKGLIPVLVLVLTLIGLYSLIDTNIKTIKEYKNVLNMARDYASQGIVDDAVKYYKKALEYKTDAATYIEYVNVYVDNGFDKKALRVAEEMVKDVKKSKEAYACLLDRYIALKEFGECFALDDEVTKKKLKSEEFAQKMAAIEFAYEYDYRFYDEVNTFSGGFAAVKTGDLYGVVNETGKSILNKMYKEAGNFSYFTNKKNKDDSAYVLPVCTKEDKWEYVSSSGNKKVEIDESLNFDYLGLYVDNGLTAASIDKKYAYYNSSFEKQLGDYYYAGTFNCGRAAVEISENEWYIIDDQGNKINSTPYVDVVLDEKEIAFRNNRAFVLIGNDYCLIDENCNVISDMKYVDARPFITTKTNEKDDKSFAYAAVCVGQKWGFIDTEGNVVIEPSFSDAHSFSNMFAAVKKDGKWGFINTSGEIVIDCTFEDVKDFNSKGCVFVNEHNRWSLIKLYRYNH